MHAPQYLRDAFQAMVDVETRRVDTYDDLYQQIFDDKPMVIPEQLCWKLANCSDMMPKALCDDLNLPQGAPYSMGAGAFIASPLAREFDNLEAGRERELVEELRTGTLENYTPSPPTTSRSSR